MPEVAVILPVRDQAALLPDCLEEVLRQARPLGAEVVVVDDASADESGAAAGALGARVVTRSSPGGPYVARNDGWRSSEAGRFVFIDIRSRPHPGWLEALTAALLDEDVAVAGGDVFVTGGPRVAERWAARRQHLLASGGSEGQFLPYFPTCNLGVRREVLEALGGFRSVTSGGDVDLCWRAQVAGLGRAQFVADAQMSWVPRATVAEAASQWRKYGRNNPLLYAAFAAAGCTVDPPPPWARLLFQEAKGFLGTLTKRRARDWDVDAVDRLCRLAYWRGYREGHRALRRGEVFGPVGGTTVDGRSAST
jgi:glycosyltransferase involved in cell wall biosynthesis